MDATAVPHLAHLEQRVGVACQEALPGGLLPGRTVAAAALQRPEGADHDLVVYVHETEPLPDALRGVHVVETPVEGVPCGMILEVLEPALAPEDLAGLRVPLPRSPGHLAPLPGEEDHEVGLAREHGPRVRRPIAVQEVVAAEQLRDALLQQERPELWVRGAREAGPPGAAVLEAGHQVVDPDYRLLEAVPRVVERQLVRTVSLGVRLWPGRQALTGREDLADEFGELRQRRDGRDEPAVAHAALRDHASGHVATDSRRADAGLRGQLGLQGGGRQPHGVAEPRASREAVFPMAPPLELRGVQPQPTVRAIRHPGCPWHFHGGPLRPADAALLPGRATWRVRSDLDVELAEAWLEPPSQGVPLARLQLVKSHRRRAQHLVA
mmetsp:Transcript_17651/g.53139  ORF Transcript_17651/g.53139 Transcript_17651/m.53139 type:complete len:381 (-) Transcript_17651:422-1564(-)